MHPLLQKLADQVTATTSVLASAKTFIDGTAGRIQEAVNKVLAGGATAEQLAPIQAEIDALNQSSQAVADAIVANTPAA